MRDGILLLVGYKFSELCVCCYGFFAHKMVVQHGDARQHPECQLAEQMLSDMFFMEPSFSYASTALASGQSSFS